MTMRHLVACVATLVAAASASAQEVGEAAIPLCDSTSSTLIVTVKGADKTKAVNDALAAIKSDKPLCAARGAHDGVWVLDGTAKAVQVGLVPAGVDGAPHLLVQKPRYRLIGPLSAEVVNTNN